MLDSVHRVFRSLRPIKSKSKTQSRLLGSSSSRARHVYVASVRSVALWLIVSSKRTNKAHICKLAVNTDENHHTLPAGSPHLFSGRSWCLTTPLPATELDMYARGNTGKCQRCQPGLWVLTLTVLQLQQHHFHFKIGELDGVEMHDTHI